MNSAVRLGQYASSRLKALPLPSLEWRPPNLKQWCRTLESIANSLDPVTYLEHAAACARAWGDRVAEPSVSA